MIEIRTAEDFSNIRNNLSGNYILMNDIDFSGVEFIPIGDNKNPFIGFIEGQGYRLKNIVISGTESYNGIFRRMEDAKITNLSFENCIVNGGYSTGVLCGQSYKSEIISLNFINCTVNGNSNTGIVAGYVSESQYNNLKINNSIVNDKSGNSGLICGYAWNITLSSCYCENSKIYSKYNVGTVTGYGNVNCNNCFFHNIEISCSDPNYKYFQYIGGITGAGDVVAVQCYINVKIKDTAEWSGEKYFNVGGINGASWSTKHNISNCAIFIDITSYGGDIIQYIGGISPNSNQSYIENCYIVMNVNTNASFGRYCGSLFGYTSQDTVISTYYNADINVPIDDQAIPKTTDELKIRDTFQNWDFENIWGIHPEINEGYPYLRIFYPEVPDEPDPDEQPEKVILYFIDIPQVNIQSPTANVVTVFSPTAEYTAAIPGISEDEKVERIVEIEEGNGQVCRIIANELLKRWSKEQKSITGPVQLCLGLEFQQKVRVINKEAMLDEYMPVQKLEHDIINQITRVTAGDLILSDEELLARILEKL